jgi:small subunit ribosomal protein S17
VVSAKMENTIVVSIPVVKMHPIYKKRYTQYKKCYAHIDSIQECTIGDRVKIRQSKPISKLKKWSFIEKVS